MKKIVSLVYLSIAISVASAQPAITVTPEDGKVTLAGNGGGITNPTHIDVYRGTSNPPSSLYTTFVPTGFNYSWEDTDVTNDVFYYYRVKSRNENEATESVFSDVVASMPAADRGSYYLFDGVDDKVELLDKNFLINMSYMSFDFKIDELEAGKDTDIFKLQFKPNAHFTNNSYIYVTHTADNLKVVVNQENSGNPTSLFTLNAHDVADGEWHTLQFENLRFTTITVRLDNTAYTMRIYSQTGPNEFTGGIFKGGNHDIIVGESDGVTSYLKGSFDNFRIFVNGSLNAQWNFDEPTDEPTVFDLKGTRHMQKSGGIVSVSDFYNPEKDTSNLQAVANSTGSIDLGSLIRTASLDISSFSLSREMLPGGPTVVLKDDLNLADLFPFEDDAIAAGTPYKYTIDYTAPLDDTKDTTISVSDISVPATGFGFHYAFDGVDDDVTLDQSVIEDSEGTVEFLVKIAPEDEPDGDQYTLVGKHESGSRNGFIIVHDASTVWCQFKEEGSNTGNLYPVSSQRRNLADGEWHHVALTYEVGNTGILYVDGEAVATNNIPDFTFTSYPLFVGNGPNTFWQPLKGGIDEVVVWNSVLSQEEISDRAFVKVSGDADGLLAAYHFDEATGTIAYDDGLNNEHATLSGASIGQTTSDIPIHWNGSMNTDWNQPSNWNIGAIPSAGNDIMITATSNAPVITSGDEVDVNKLIINSGASLTVESEGILAIREEATINGTYTVERRPEGIGRYSMIGSPLADTDISDFSASHVYAYDEATSLYDLLTSGAAQPGQGFFVAFPAAETDPIISLTGTPNTGTIAVDLSRQNITGEHYNLVANPYAAPLNYSSFTFSNSSVIEESIWLWDDGDANAGDNRAGDYMVVNNVGIVSSTGPGIGSTGSSWNGFIGSFQGFFVRANEMGVGDLTFTPDMQVTNSGSNNDQNHFRATEVYPYHSIKLSLSGEGLYNELIVALSDESTFDRDRLDAEKIKGNPHIAFYSWQGDKVYAIQGLPKLELVGDSLSVPLGFDLTEPGDFEISVVEMKNVPADYTIVLKDHLLDVEYKMDEESTIPFSLAEQESESRRFELVLEIASALSEASRNSKLLVYQAPTGLEVFYPSAEYEKVTIYRLDGRKVFEQQVKFENQALIHPLLSPGHMYIISVGEESNKFIHR